MPIKTHEELVSSQLRTLKRQWMLSFELLSYLDVGLEQ